jgi:kumamolisin
MPSKSATPPKSRRFTLYRARTAPTVENEAPPPNSVEVSLLLRRRARLPSLEEHARTPPAQRQYLTHETLRKKHGLRSTDLKAVKAFAAKYDLALVQEEPRLRSMSCTVRLSGSLESVATAFGLEGDLRWRKDSSGRWHPFHTGAVRPPSELRDIVRDVLGLDERIPVNRLMAARSQLAASPQEAARPQKTKATGRLAAESGPDLVFTAPEIARLYDFPARRGKGQCIGIIELFGGYNKKDMEQYIEGMPSTGKLKVPDIQVIGSNEPGHSVSSDLEVAMDTQIIGAICNDARIVVYLPRGPQEPPGLKTFYDVLCSAIYDEKNRPSVLSVSWGFSENTDKLSSDWRNPFNELLHVAALLGITLCVSSGDQGSFAPPLSQNTQAMWSPAVFFIASSPYVLSCGGTTLRVRDGAIDSEVVWNRLGEALNVETSVSGSDTVDSQTVCMASGGGVSLIFKRPEFQAAARVPLATTYRWQNGVLSRQQPFAGRGVPDVAAVADIRTGVQFFFNDWVVGGGTSAAAPIWASLLLLLNEGLSNQTGKESRLGWFNPTLYHLCLKEGADVLRPITQGTNGGFSASPELRWNACTGLGSPRGRSLEAALLRQSQALRGVK